MRASVIVPSYKRREALEHCLRFLLAQTIAPERYEIVVVDDGSGDDTAAFMTAVVERHPHVRFARHDRNRGLSAARNTGIRAASGEVVIMLDNDMEPEPGFVEAHLRRHEAEPGALGVVSNVRLADDRIAGRNFGRYLQERYLGFRPARERAQMDYEDLPARCFAGGVSSVRRETILALGGFDERIQGYGAEDEKMGHTLRQAGVRLVFEAAARVVHHDDVSLPRYRAKCIEIAQGGYRLLREKCPEYFEGTMVRLLLPVDLRRDSWRRVAAKTAVHLTLSRPVVWALGRWAEATDARPGLYAAAVFRALTAGWLLQGFRTRFAGRLVDYGSGR